MSSLNSIDNEGLRALQNTFLQGLDEDNFDVDETRKKIQNFVNENALTDPQKRELKLFIGYFNKEIQKKTGKNKQHFEDVTTILNAQGNISLDPEDHSLSRLVAALRIENLKSRKALPKEGQEYSLAITESGRVFVLDEDKPETLIGEGTTKKFIQAFDYETLEEVTYSETECNDLETAVVDKIHQEYEMLKKLSPSPYFPQVFCQIETAHNKVSHFSLTTWKIRTVQTLYEPFSKVIFDSLSDKGKLHIYRGLLKAVSILEDNKIVHRDIKPDNVLFRRREENGQIVIDGILADFDLAIYAEKLTAELAKAAERVAMGKDVNYRFAGTPYYMSPECFEPKAPALVLPFKLDSWGVGITGYEMFVKETEYQKTAKTINELTTDMNEILTRTLDGKVTFEENWLVDDWLTTQNGPFDFDTDFRYSILFCVLKRLCNPDPQKRMSAKEAGELL